MIACCPQYRVQPIAARAILNSLDVTSAFWVFQRHAERYGARSMVPCAHVRRLAPGILVQYPLLVFAGDPQNRSAFSHSTTPPQLSRSTLRVTSRVEYRPPYTRRS